MLENLAADLKGFQTARPRAHYSPDCRCAHDHHLSSILSTRIHRHVMSAFHENILFPRFWEKLSTILIPGFPPSSHQKTQVQAYAATCMYMYMYMYMLIRCFLTWSMCVKWCICNSIYDVTFLKHMQAYAYSQAHHIIGIEVNSYFSELQARVISKYNLSSRIKVVNADVRHQAELLHTADVVVLNNVFEFFCSLEEQARWA